MDRLAPSSSPNVRINAILLQEQIGVRDLARKGAGALEAQRFFLGVAAEVQRSFRRGPKSFKFYGLILLKTAELDLLVHQDHSLGVAWVHAKDLGDPLLYAQIAGRRADVARRINRSYRHCIRLVSYATQVPYRGFLVRALLRIAQPVGILLLRLRREGMAQQVKEFSSAALGICQLCAEMAAEINSENEVAMAAHTALAIDLDTESAAGKWARDVIAGLSDENIRRDAEAFVAKAELRRKGEHFEGDIATTPKQVFESLAEAYGIDLTEDTAASRAVRVGIADFDPSRILRDCESLQVEPGGTGLPGVWLGLWSAGSKTLRCARHGHAMGGFELDVIYSGVEGRPFLPGFKSEFCVSCPDAKPRPGDWKWSPEDRKVAESRRAEHPTGRDRE